MFHWRYQKRWAVPPDHELLGRSLGKKSKQLFFGNAILMRMTTRIDIIRNAP
jgi:hypothetical protein